MTDVELLAASALDRFVPPPGGGRADWQDVLVRAGVVRRRRRAAVAVAAAAAAAVVATTTPVGSAIAHGLGDFSGWLTGRPGSPAPAAEQHRFAAANGLSWAAFPRTTRLRELIRADVGGREYVLYGFRSGGWLCLKLQAVTLGHGTEPGCAPLSTVGRVSAPVVVVVGSDGFADRFARPSAQFSYGIAADGVRRVDVEATDGRHRALLGGNAYLWVENDPSTGNHVLSVSAVAAGGRRTTLRQPASGFDLPASAAAAPGPRRVEARIAHPRIGWLARGERRGLTLQQARLTREQTRQLAQQSIAALVKPDPLGDVVVGVSVGDSGSCLAVVGGGTACTRGSFFLRGPVWAGFWQGAFARSDRFLVAAGAVADGVARVRVFSSDGDVQTAALRDNLFTALVPNRPPLRVVGYDRRGRAVGIETSPGYSFGVAPRAATVLRPVERVPAPNGAVATLSAGPEVGGARCWRVAYSGGRTERACELRYGGGPQIRVRTVQPVGGDVFVLGAVGPAVARVRLELPGGGEAWTRPRDGLFLIAVPRAHLSPRRQLAYVVGIDRQGRRVQRQAVLYRAG